MVRRGFTLVEVALFLVITAAVFVGIAIGTQSSIFQQRYNDAVQNYAEFLRTVYSQVTNVQSESTGRSDQAIYGKLVTFNVDEDNNNIIKTYNVIGRVEENDLECSSDSVLQKLACVNANVIVEKDENGSKVYSAAGFVDTYSPRWSSQIQTAAGWGNNDSGSGYTLFTGALLIVRSPSSGTVYTYVTDKQIDVDAVLQNGSSNKNPFIVSEGEGGNLLTNHSFVSEEVNFCVNPNGAERSNLRRDIRIIKGARNSSGVEIVSEGTGCEP